MATVIVYHSVVSPLSDGQTYQLHDSKIYKSVATGCKHCWKHSLFDVSSVSSSLRLLAVVVAVMAVCRVGVSFHLFTLHSIVWECCRNILIHAEVVDVMALKSRGIAMPRVAPGQSRLNT
ncbi:hypothetical protein E2C01_083019 [Portunus trituberculatus]|uniref:Uncharacterized protein n=1 Tax=Portunus trituberculatus TaxID=210409 RepID=A0A5B7J2C2_PORTR|nr:hypothetical protein [Portunus trituberculatus]